MPGSLQLMRRVSWVAPALTAVQCMHARRRSPSAAWAILPACCPQVTVTDVKGSSRQILKGVSGYVEPNHMMVSRWRWRCRAAPPRSLQAVAGAWPPWRAHTQGAPVCMPNDGLLNPATFTHALSPLPARPSWAPAAAGRPPCLIPWQAAWRIQRSTQARRRTAPCCWPDRGATARGAAPASAGWQAQTCRAASRPAPRRAPVQATSA